MAEMCWHVCEHVIHVCMWLEMTSSRPEMYTQCSNHTCNIIMDTIDILICCCIVSNPYSMKVEQKNCQMSLSSSHHVSSTEHLKERPTNLMSLVKMWISSWSPLQTPVAIVLPWLMANLMVWWAMCLAGFAIRSVCILALPVQSANHPVSSNPYCMTNWLAYIHISSMSHETRWTTWAQWVHKGRAGQKEEVGALKVCFHDTLTSNKVDAFRASVHNKNTRKLPQTLCPNTLESFREHLKLKVWEESHGEAWGKPNKLATVHTAHLAPKQLIYDSDNPDKTQATCLQSKPLTHNETSICGTNDLPTGWVPSHCPEMTCL